jgi:hypothetical protein
MINSKDNTFVWMVALTSAISGGPFLWAANVVAVLGLLVVWEKAIRLKSKQL